MLQSQSIVFFHASFVGQATRHCCNQRISEDIIFCGIGTVNRQGRGVPRIERSRSKWAAQTFRDTTFLEEARIFSYRIGRNERLGIPWPHYENSTYLSIEWPTGRHKMPADLFKKALESFRKRVIIIINLILAGHYECKPTDLEARVILICKDASNSEFFSYYRPIALCNAFYQLVYIVIKSRLRVLVERYSVLESS